MLELLPKRHFGAILADPPWRYLTWDKREAIPRTRSDGTNVSAEVHYRTMPIEDIAALPVGELAADDCALFLWATWPNLLDALTIVTLWGFEYKTCAFCWTKAHAGQLEMFGDGMPDQMGLGYWTRANSEPCLLATRGRPKRLNADVRQAIIEPRREHSRKPDCVHERIERLVAGPYLELFARRPRPGWTVWGNEVDKFRGALGRNSLFGKDASDGNPLDDPLSPTGREDSHNYNAEDDFARSIDECYAEVRKRKAAGGKGWPCDYDHAEELERQEVKRERLLDEYK